MEGFRSRAAYKLQEMQKKYHFIRMDDNIVDLGASPGSWLQVLRVLTKGKVVGIDLIRISPLEGVTTMIGNFSDSTIQDIVRETVRPIHVIVCDAAPHLTGQRSYDQAISIGIGRDALAFALRCLKPGGMFVVKSFQGDMFDEFVREVREHFISVHLFKPKATRKGSAEIYIIGKKLKG